MKIAQIIDGFLYNLDLNDSCEVRSLELSDGTTRSLSINLCFMEDFDVDNPDSITREIDLTVTDMDDCRLTMNLEIGKYAISIGLMDEFDKEFKTISFEKEEAVLFFEAALQLIKSLDIEQKTVDTI